MKLAKSLGGMAAAYLFLSTTTHAGIILQEDFEDNVLTYQVTEESLLDLNNNDYFGRVAQNQLPSNINFVNVQGSHFFAVQDTDGALPSAVDSVRLSWQNIDISNWQNLMLSWFIAEDDSSDGREDIDTSTFFEINAQVDKGGFSSIFSVRSADGTNSQPAVDTNFDGVGDGVEITDAFQQFSYNLAVGQILDIEVVFENFDAGDEDFAFDQLTLSGDPRFSPVNVPEPSTNILLAGAVFGMFSYRRLLKNRQFGR